MLISEVAILKWNSKNKKYYTDLGYTFTKMGDEFEVNINDLTPHSRALVTVKCDYCGKEFITQWRKYYQYNILSPTGKDTCLEKECINKKREECCLLNYGVKSIWHVDSFRERVNKIKLEKYGTECTLCNDEVREKINKTFLEKYGTIYPIQTDAVKNKRIQNCLKKYGVEYYMQTEEWKKANSGENSAVWKGDKASYDRTERYDPKYREWRRSVFRRDGYTCQCCGTISKAGIEKPVYINAHHIKNWKDNPEDRFDVDNGITLCMECHNLFHNEYGRHNNTREQLDEFLQNHKSDILNEDKKVC